MVTAKLPINLTVEDEAKILIYFGIALSNRLDIRPRSKFKHNFLLI